MKTLKLIYPPRLLLMILFVQLISVLMNYNIYDSRELAILLCWIPLLTIPYYFTKNKLFYKLIIIYFFIEGLISLLHWLILKGPLNATSIFIISNTNMAEAKEFVDFNLNIKMLLLIPYFYFSIKALKHDHEIIETPKSKFIIALVLVYSIVFITENVINNRFLRKSVPQSVEAVVSFADELKTYETLKKRTLKPVVINSTKKTNQEQVFVLIIGESCSRNHMSLYHYKTPTNPKLSARKDLIVYKNVVSAYSSTMKSVLSILSESNLENEIDIDKSISLIDVFHAAGYKTFWLSNQSPFGVWDNAIFNLAQTSDVVKYVNTFANSSFESISQSSFDEQLFEPFQKTLNDNSKNKFIIVHLMGSHSAYENRYPAAFNKFTNYTTSNERQIFEYDNSILYNDFIIDSLLSSLNLYAAKNKHTVASAIYLSDHGENVYDENNTIGHYTTDNLPKANVEIPFIVWLSESYRQLYPDKQKTIITNSTLPFVSDDLFHTVLDINNIACKAFIKERSVFNPEFNAKRIRVLEDKKNYDLK